MRKKQEMRKEARTAIIETLKDGYNGYYCDLHNEVFNTDYYVIGTYEAKEALKEYGVFEAIEKIQEYEKDNFGEIYTDLSDPEKVVNMLYYIIGEEVLFEMMDGIKAWDDNWNNKADEETNAEILKAIEDMRIKKLVNEVYDILETIDYKISRETIKGYIEQEGAEELHAQTITYYIRLYNITD